MLALVALAAAEPAGSGQSPKSNSVPSVKFKVQNRWVSYEDFDRKARDYLREKGIVPPRNDTPSFEIFPKVKPGAFIGVRYGHQFGKSAWYISFDSNGKIINYDTWIVSG
jgi:hypothetical protein